MATKTLMSVTEYLHTSFEGADCEYLDGEVVGRNMGEMPHASVQSALIYLLVQIAPGLALRVSSEIRIQINPQRYRVADIAVWRAGNIGERIPTVPPFLAIEILSPEDRMVRMQPKVQEYLAIGTEYVWLIDPLERKALCYSEQDRAGTVCDVLRTDNPRIELALEDVLRRAAI